MKKGKMGAGHRNNHVRGKQKKLQLVSTEQERIKFWCFQFCFGPAAQD